MSSDDDPKDLTKDIVQIGVNEEIAEKLQNMMDDLDPQWFSSMQDIYKFAVAVAIAKDLKPDMKAKNLKAKTWRWADTAKDSSGTGDRLDDKNQTFGKMVQTFAPECEDAPYKYSQYLAIPGIYYLYNEMHTKKRTPSEILEEFFPDEDEE